MINVTKKVVTLLLVLFAAGAYAQYNPQYQHPVTVTEPFGSSLTDYPALLIIDTQTPIVAGQMQANGADIRFSTDCAYTQLNDYWIESGINTTTTRIWVRIPSMAASGTQNLFMTYGDATAAAASSFAATFPNAVITSGDITLSGVQQPGWLHVQASDTLFVTAGSPLEIIAGYVRIDGVIMAQGRGYQASAINTSGTGPGAGTTSTNSGSGGGSYAGTGGTGGLDAGDTPGTGGPPYGTLSGNDIDMGSSGGSGTTMGGSGGGSVTIKASRLYVNGAINSNGANGLATSSRGGGGGAGGGILLMSDSVVVSGTVTASGGNGGQGTSTANDGGGGGGGGRTKIFSDAGSNVTGTVASTGGTGGGFGDQAQGQPGTAGTNHTGTWIYTDASVAGQSVIPIVVYNETTTSVCENASAVTLTPATPAGGTYSGPGVTGTTFNPAAAGAGTHTVTYSYVDGAGCTRTGSSQVTVNALPTVTYNETTTIVCADASAVTLAPGTPAGGTYSGPGVSGTTFDPATAGAGTHTVTYSFTDGMGCMSSDVSQIVVNALPAVSYVETAGTVCVDNPSFTLAAGSPAGGAYTGPGVTGNMFDPATAGLGTHNVIYTYIDGMNCMSSDTAQIVVDACTGITAIEGGKISIYPNPADDNIVLNIPSFKVNSNIKIFNALGSMVADIAVDANTTRVNVSELATGVYTVALYSGNEFVQNTRLVIK